VASQETVMLPKRPQNDRVRHKENAMTTFQVQDTVGAMVARLPAMSRVFEQAGIDYCCGGKRTLDDVCREKGLDAESFLAELEESALAADGQPLVDAASMSLTELADHIEQSHHAYLRSELPRLDWITHKVASVHGEHDPRLHEIRKVFLAFTAELSSHMMKEEHVLFPMIRQLEASSTAPNFHCGSLANPMRQMESEHHDAGSALGQLSELSDGYTPPDWACNTYRAMLDALAHLQLDMHGHVHKEESILFPNALKLEAELAERGS
jgi:regulator of cell morphogenesis and NO signaling